MNPIPRRKLPHIYPRNTIFFITFRLFDSLPQSQLKTLITENRTRTHTLDKMESKGRISQLNFEKYEDQLDGAKYGDCVLSDVNVASILANKIKQYDGIYYELICYCIMPNHVHLLVDTQIQSISRGETIEEMKSGNVSKWMKLIKGGASFEINKHLNRTGSLWSAESFDRYVRNEIQFQNFYNYIIDNPIKAKLPKKYCEYPFMYENLDYGKD